jgi:hypothetical protein
MFANVQRGDSGLSNIIAVAALLVLYVASAGLMWKSYREGGKQAGEPGCHIACMSLAKKSASRG